MSFDQLTIQARNILAMESEAVRMLDGTDTDHVLATMTFLDECRKVRQSIYSHPAWAI
jgi:hypothetical protein